MHPDANGQPRALRSAVAGRAKQVLGCLDGQQRILCSCKARKVQTNHSITHHLVNQSIGRDQDVGGDGEKAIHKAAKRRGAHLLGDGRRTAHIHGK